MAFFTKRYNPAGTPPGTLTAGAPSGAGEFTVRLIDYNAHQITELEDIDAAACEPYLGGETVTWVHVQGRPNETVLEEFGQVFELHPLALEDVLNTGQRPKIEPFPDQLFVVMSLPLMVGDVVEVRQASFFLGKNFLVSFCEGEFAPFEPIIKRLQYDAGRLRSRAADFLLYSLLDVVVDQGFPVLESFGSQLEDLEEQILVAGDEDTLVSIHTVKRELVLLRRMLWPQREVINQLLRDEHALVAAGTHIYLRDCYDHTIQVMDLLETYRDMTGSMLDIYLSSVSNRMNDVMRILTVIATVFIPLTFITGIYGMNFDRRAGPWSMPELGQPYGYVGVWLLMIVIVVAMIVFFRRQKWF